MQPAKTRDVLRKVWIGYAALMMAFPVIGIMTGQFHAEVLVVSVCGGWLFWAARNALQKKAADITLQAFFLIIAVQCMAALFMGGVLTPLITLPLLLGCIVSFILWRKTSGAIPKQNVQ